MKNDAAEKKPNAIDGEQQNPRRACSTRRAQPLASLCLCLLAQIAQSPLDRLEPVQRAKLLGSLILLTVGGVAMVVLAWLMLRVGRRSSRREDVTLQQFRERANADDWATKPLVKPEDSRQDSDFE